MTTAPHKNVQQPKPTMEEAKAACLSGWNLRCNRCGMWGAAWFRGMRPNFGSLALCGPHEDELYAVKRRHAEEWAEVTKVMFEQPSRSAA